MERSDRITGPEPEFITVVEGPEPEFAEHHDVWALSVLEGFRYIGLERCLVRTFNGTELVERCRSAWAEGRPVLLDYPNRLGLRQRIEIAAARAETVEEGDVLYLWVRSQETQEDGETS